VSEPIRSFIAVKLPPESAERIRAAQERLRAADADVKWVDAASFHITLKFLGGVQQDRLSALWRSVTAALEGSRPIALHLRGIGAFPNPGRARVVWAGATEGAVRRPRPNAELAAAIAEQAEVDLGEAHMDRVLLMKSELTRAGAIYHILEQIPLGEEES